MQPAGAGHLRNGGHGFIFHDHGKHSGSKLMGLIHDTRHLFKRLRMSLIKFYVTITCCEDTYDPFK